MVVWMGLRKVVVFVVVVVVVAVCCGCACQTRFKMLCLGRALVQQKNHISGFVHGRSSKKCFKCTHWFFSATQKNIVYAALSQNAEVVLFWNVLAKSLGIYTASSRTVNASKSRFHMFQCKRQQTMQTMKIYNVFIRFGPKFLKPHFSSPWLKSQTKHGNVGVSLFVANNWVFGDLDWPGYSLYQLYAVFHLSCFFSWSPEFISFFDPKSIFFNPIPLSEPLQIRLIFGNHKNPRISPFGQHQHARETANHHRCFRTQPTSKNNCAKKSANATFGTHASPSLHILPGGQYVKIHLPLLRSLVPGWNLFRLLGWHADWLRSRQTSMWSSLSSYLRQELVAFGILELSLMQESSWIVKTGSKHFLLSRQILLESRKSLTLLRESGRDG